MALSRRSQNEVEAYIEGFNACFKRFVEYLKKHKADDAIGEMLVIKWAINAVGGKDKEEAEE